MPSAIASAKLIAISDFENHRAGNREKKKE